MIKGVCPKGERSRIPPAGAGGISLARAEAAGLGSGLADSHLPGWWGKGTGLQLNWSHWGHLVTLLFASEV